MTLVDAVSLVPVIVSVMLAVPALTPVTTPWALTVATVLSDDIHTIVFGSRPGLSKNGSNDSVPFAATVAVVLRLREPGTGNVCAGAGGGVGAGGGGVTVGG